MGYLWHTLWHRESVGQGRAAVGPGWGVEGGGWRVEGGGLRVGGDLVLGREVRQARYVPLRGGPPGARAAR